MKRTVATLFAGLVMLVFGCTTSARFIIPDGTELIVQGKTAKRNEREVYLSTRPFPWASARGVNYQLLDKNGVLASGKLRTGFRAASLFWPPYAFLYWPRGFRFDCYDLTKAVPASCEVKKAPAGDESAMPWDVTVESRR